MFSSKRLMAGLISWPVVFFAAMMMTSPARAAVHLWNLQELYSNSSGTLQFIELFTTSSTQTRFDIQRTITSANVGGGMSSTFNVPLGLIGATANKSLLFGTAGIQAASGVTPDYIIPNNFLFAGGGTISFFGANGGAYTALPTNGTASRIWTGGGNNTINSPTNFGGQTGVVVVPEPTSIVLVPLALGGMYWMSRRRKVKSLTSPTQDI